jgi:hypothetical protein
VLLSPDTSRTTSVGATAPFHATEQAADVVAEVLRDAERSLA